MIMDVIIYIGMGAKGTGMDKEKIRAGGKRALLTVLLK
jgi:hypothetical protein